MLTNKKILLIVISCFFVSGCQEKKQQTMDVSVLDELEFSAWVTEWQWQSGVEDLRQVQGVDRAQVFAAYFDEEDHVYLRDKMDDAIDAMKKLSKERNIPLDLTIVNDQFLPDGTVVHKDSELIGRLVETPESRKRHIDNILEYVDAYQFEGLEIDYENISKEDLPNLLQFYKELYDVLQAQGKPLRILLEPNLHVEQYNFPVGPVYVMMAYNLYGGHSEPGPKADDEFIRIVVNKMKTLPGQPVIALSTGGFSWLHGKDEMKTLTETEAEDLAEKSKVIPMRDPSSGGMYFDYQDKHGETFTVWYGDRQTLYQWMKIAAEEGQMRVSLWRMGGMETSTLEFLNKAVNYKARVRGENGMFANHIKELRKEMNLTQAELAERVGIGRTALSKIENGAYYPSAKTMKKISDVLNKPIGEIFFNTNIS
ncbi:glycosyl hydrolase [Sporosarcina sp. P12(2017)]|uniref:helix-turn-helix domain-containing protein n=1 Tax=unclassified Sporosarcina TaxID=2647733 RepID=UPI000C165F3B|nr:MULTISPECIES: helix-turn-helix domain-containing protein [unclassified Sporosarcina]PIC56348.1 glycosyl hydrolase [Sporosarcina sp. P10]PIC59645.1 glycosyl hydrolase [Sporosarcina sp. P12(2017)]